MAIITISRGSYSKGKEIAEKVAQGLNYEHTSRDVLLEASEHFNVPEIKLIRALHDAPSILNHFTYGKEKYVAYIKEAFLDHMIRDNIVYHGLAGHSGGGSFGLYVLFSKPESFSKYIISSPGDGPWLEMEQSHYEKHKDLAAKVFLSAGEAEMTDYFVAKVGKIVSTVASVAERLTVREYPSLELEARIIPGAGHGNVMAMAYARAIPFLWEERLQEWDSKSWSRYMELALEYMKKTSR